MDGFLVQAIRIEFALAKDLDHRLVDGGPDPVLVGVVGRQGFGQALADHVQRLAVQRILRQAPFGCFSAIPAERVEHFVEVAARRVDCPVASRTHRAATRGRPRVVPERSLEVGPVTTLEELSESGPKSLESLRL
ncbi:MAG: hypothetical protein EOR10_31445 [Mesorhizobium sp.]|nr:MAG: hypothetical protein EOR10_31445 [Mesorhizobium sp.]